MHSNILSHTVLPAFGPEFMIIIIWKQMNICVLRIYCTPIRRQFQIKAPFHAWHSRRCDTDITSVWNIIGHTSLLYKDRIVYPINLII